MVAEMEKFSVNTAGRIRREQLGLALSKEDAMALLKQIYLVED